MAYVGDQKDLLDTTKITIAVRAVIYGRRPWLLHEDLSEHERQRISKRFNDEIISKSNNYLQNKRQSKSVDSNPVQQTRKS